VCYYYACDLDASTARAYARAVAMVLVWGGHFFSFSFANPFVSRDARTGPIPKDSKRMLFVFFLEIRRIA
jgi:hypothetical protein